MKTFAIVTHDVRIQKGCMAMLMNALEKASTETPHASQDVSFAGILKKRRKETASAHVSSFNKKNPTTSSPDTTAKLIGKMDAAETSSRTKQTKESAVLSLPDNKEGTPADGRKLPVSIGVDETSLPAVSDPVFTQMSNIATPAPVIVPAPQEGAVALAAVTTERESPSVQTLPADKISLPSGKIRLEIPLQGATKPDNRISAETMPLQDHAPAANNNILNEETALPDKAPGAEEMLKTRVTPTMALTEKTDAAIMNSAALQKDRPVTPDNASGSERTAKPTFQAAAIQAEKTDATVINTAAYQKDEPVTPVNAAISEQTIQAALETEVADEDRMPRHPSTRDVKPSAESKFMDRVAGLLRQKEDGPAPENILSQVRRTVVSTRNDHPSTLSPKDAPPPAATHNPATIVSNERDLASKPVFLEHPESAVELPDRAVTMKEGAATVTGHDTHSDKNRPLTLARTANPAERELFPFRVDPLSTASAASETKAPLFDNPAGNRTQAIINQIIDAKQAMNGDFGRVRIVLSPPNLGTVDLEIVFRNERVEVVMTADNSSVQQALQSRADDIRNALQRHDLKIEAFQVLLQDQEANRQHPSHGGALFEHRQENQSTRDFKDSDAAPLSSPIPNVSFIQGSGPEKGRVSIFV